MFPSFGCKTCRTLRPDERQPFKERWLGRYIAYDIESFFVAITEVGTVAGYLAGCLNNPAHNPRFADIGYYASFAPLCDCYPCHLHINLDERYRNRGIGSALIAAFAAQAASAGRPGIHVVTDERARNVRFYEKNEISSACDGALERCRCGFHGPPVSVTLTPSAR